MAAILAIHAHPDDIETLAAGTLALLAARGHALCIVTATAGDLGSTTHDREEAARVRRAEARASADLIGAAYRCADLPDFGVFNDDICRRAITEMVRWAAPDIVLTASPQDYHPDHEAVSVLARDACFAAPISNYATGDAPILRAIPHLYFMDPIGGRAREGERIKPDFGANIAAVIETKKSMLAKHESQFGWVAKQHDVPDAVQSMVAWAARRGRDFAVEYAEGFRHYRGHPFPRTPMLQDLLGADLLTPTV